MRRIFRSGVVLILPALCLAGDIPRFQLPPPQTTGGKPLMEVLKARKSTRAFGPEKLSKQTISNLLWAAFGINRDDGRRTAPSAMNRQEIDIYVASAEGLFLFDAKPHQLKPILTEDLRGATGTQDFVRTADLNLIYVADYARMGNSPAEDRLLYSAAATGFIAQNAYLFCASEGLATVVRASVDRTALAQAMHLRPEQHIILVQSLGYPAK